MTQQLRFINPAARTHRVMVAAVSGDDPLVFNQVYTVSDELAVELLKNNQDWELAEPKKKGSKEVDE